MLKSAVLLYGQPGSGRTGAACEAVPKGVWAGVPDRFNSAFYWGGIPREWPTIHPARNLKEMTAGLKLHKARAKEAGIVLDDMTLALQAELALIAPGVDKYAWPHYQTLGNHTTELLGHVNEILAAGAPVIFTVHSKEPMVDETTRKKEPGHPALTGSSYTQITGVADIFACIRESEEPYHPYRLHTRTVGDYIARSRHTCFPSKAPMAFALLLKKIFPDMVVSPRFDTYWDLLGEISQVFPEKDIPKQEFTPYHAEALKVAIAGQDSPTENLTRWLLFQGHALAKLNRKPSQESIAAAISF